MKRTVLIIGSDATASTIARELAQSGISTILALQNDLKSHDLPDTGAATPAQAVEVLSQAQLSACRGFAGDYQVTLQHQGQVIERSVACIVLAEKETRQSNAAAYALAPGKQVLTVSEAAAGFAKDHTADAEFEGKRVAFLVGLDTESNPIITREALQLCLALQSQQQAQTYYLTTHLKVAGNGLEALYREAKAAGTLFFKFSGERPEVQPSEKGLTQISFFDDVSRDTYRLQADFTIVDETICPSQQLAENANTLSIACDASGYAQADNVRRYPHATNRKGIFVAGCARQPSDPMAQAMEARSVALSVMRFLEGEEHQALPTAAIHRQKCVRCLTCLRLCPYQAIALHAKPEIMPEACQGCGICAAECPAVAIEMDPLTHLAMTQKLTSLRSDHDQQRRDSPFLVAFCCARSAKIAQEMAFAMGHRLPPGLALVNVPCAGSISLGHLLAAFQSQADGVLVLTCHPDNCHSETGNLLAHQRATHLLALLPSLGIAQERIQVATLAANMGTEFARVASTFEKSIVALAANPIRI